MDLDTLQVRQILQPNFSYGGVACQLRTTTNFPTNFASNIEMLWMSQVRLSLLFSWDELEPSQITVSVIMIFFFNFKDKKNTMIVLIQWKPQEPIPGLIEVMY
jgi:hypothetical protein